jgi:hypothetical protein
MPAADLVAFGHSSMNSIAAARTALICTALTMLCGCAAPLPTVETRIPNTPYAVALHGPDEKHHWRYSVYENGNLVARRFLGPANVDLPVNPQVAQHGQGRVTVTWGSGPGRAFTAIDIKARTVSKDTNAANPTDEPFKLQR